VRAASPAGPHADDLMNSRMNRVKGTNRFSGRAHAHRPDQVCLASDAETCGRALENGGKATDIGYCRSRPSNPYVADFIEIHVPPLLVLAQAEVISGSARGAVIQGFNLLQSRVLRSPFASARDRWAGENSPAP